MFCYQKLLRTSSDKKIDSFDSPTSFNVLLHFWSTQKYRFVNSALIHGFLNWWFLRVCVWFKAQQWNAYFWKLKLASKGTSVLLQSQEREFRCQQIIANIFSGKILCCEQYQVRWFQVERVKLQKLVSDFVSPVLISPHSGWFQNPRVWTSLWDLECFFQLC